MYKKLLTVTIMTLAFSATGYATWTIAATNNPPTVTDTTNAQDGQIDSTTRNADRETRATNRAYPAGV